VEVKTRRNTDISTQSDRHIRQVSPVTALPEGNVHQRRPGPVQRRRKHNVAPKFVLRTAPGSKTDNSLLLLLLPRLRDVCQVRWGSAIRSIASTTQYIFMLWQSTGGLNQKILNPFIQTEEWSPRTRQYS
jgi:hypothetical protein